MPRGEHLRGEPLLSYGHIDGDMEDMNVEVAELCGHVLSGGVLCEWPNGDWTGIVTAPKPASTIEAHRRASFGTDGWRGATRLSASPPQRTPAPMATPPRPVITTPFPMLPLEMTADERFSLFLKRNDLNSLIVFGFKGYQLTKGPAAAGLDTLNGWRDLPWGFVDSRPALLRWVRVYWDDLQQGSADV